MRIKPIGTANERPDWAPEPADRYVGFRDEFALVAGDAVVEFARFNYDGSRVTWLAVYYRSVDEVFGDRGNHAGVGVWLNDVIIADAGFLLDGLHQLSEVVAKNGPEAVHAEASAFAVQYLPKYLDLSARLPDHLDGWNFAAGNVCQTATYYSGAKSIQENWMLAADQIGRASLLPAADPNVARALILIPAQGFASQDRRFGKMTPLARPSFSEVTKVLPRAIEALAVENGTLQVQAGKLQQQLHAAQQSEERLKAELRSEQFQKETLSEQVTRLTNQLSEDGNVRWLTAIDGRLATLESTLRSQSSGLSELARIVRNVTSVPRPPEPSAVRMDPYAQVGSNARSVTVLDYVFSIWGLIFVVVIVMAFLLYYFLWR